MSYILDALKKSEAERKRGVAPSLFAVPHVASGSRTWLWAIFAALAINACLGALWLFWWSDNTMPTATTATSETVALHPAPGAATATAQTESAQSNSSIPATARRSTKDPAVVLENVSASPTSGVKPDSPEPEAEEFPFSTHIYSDDPSMRAVTLNGRRLVEGDVINENVTLKEITETGVVLDIDGRRVALDVLQDWR